jgi:hypothetical protein
LALFGRFLEKNQNHCFQKYRLTAKGVRLNSHTIMKKPLSLLAALCLGGILASGTANADTPHTAPILKASLTLLER